MGRAGGGLRLDVWLVDKDGKERFNVRSMNFATRLGGSTYEDIERENREWMELHFSEDSKPGDACVRLQNMAVESMN